MGKSANSNSAMTSFTTALTPKSTSQEESQVQQSSDNQTMNDNETSNDNQTVNDNQIMNDNEIRNDNEAMDDNEILNDNEISNDNERQDLGILGVGEDRECKYCFDAKMMLVGRYKGFPCPVCCPALPR